MGSATLPPIPESVEAPTGTSGPQRLPIAIAWGVIVAVGGGFACGALLHAVGMLGAIGLWGLGALAGFVSRKITVTPCKGVAWGLVAAVAIAFLLAETYWIRNNIVQADGQWVKAITLLPTFAAQGGTVAMFIGALFTAFGASSAFFQAGKRFRRVVVYED